VTFAIVGPPVALSGLVLPWLLDSAAQPGQWARLYFLNTLGAVIGALGTAWIVLPTLGFTKTSWLAGCLLIGFACWALPSARRWPLAVTGLLALLAVSWLDSGVGKTRVLGRLPFPRYSVVSSVDTPDACISLVETGDSHQAVVIDGFVAADTRPTESHYMPWMGRLPMLLHPDPKDVLVICFGTGQTANALRREGPERLDVVDLNQRVLDLGPRIRVNENVLADSRVKTVVMDGRAWMRRSGSLYDVITLEPMPPNFAGVNSLYSREFYQAARQRLKPGGVIAQWLPFHLVPSFHSSSIARTFQETFPNSALWLDPVGFTGILVGTTAAQPIGSELPGFSREVPRDLTKEQVQRAFALDAEGLKRLGNLGEIITDDNQMLNHHHYRLSKQENQSGINLAIVHWATTDPPPDTATPEVLFKTMRVKQEELLAIPPFQADSAR
jgi:spermidine synthase